MQKKKKGIGNRVGARFIVKVLHAKGVARVYQGSNLGSVRKVGGGVLKLLHLFSSFYFGHLGATTKLDSTICLPF